jgi:hypothetical protein
VGVTAAVAVAVGVGVSVGVGIGVSVGVGVGVSVDVGVAVGVNVAVAVGVTVAVVVAVAVGVGVKVAVAVAVAVGVGVGLAVGVGVGLIVLAACMATISLSDNALFQIATCWTLPFAYVGGGLPGFSGCIKQVRFIEPPVVSVAVAVATLTPSTNRLNAVPLRRHIRECQFPSKALPPWMGLPIMSMLLPRAFAAACVRVPCL